MAKNIESEDSDREESNEEGIDLDLDNDDI
jgi:hypothetical protein